MQRVSYGCSWTTVPYGAIDAIKADGTLSSDF
jgi:hypothetical protein